MLESVKPELKQCSRCHSTCTIEHYEKNRKGEWFKLCNNCRSKKRAQNHLSNTENEMEELFKQLPDFPDVECNAKGDVRWYRSKKLMTKYYGNMYDSFYIKYYDNMDKQKVISLFNLIGRLFVENPNNYKFIRAKDGNNSNYDASNLEWVKTRRRVKIDNDDE